MDRPEKSQELELEIKTLAFGGRGVARVDGFVFFVEGAVPGDRVRAVVTKAKPSYAEARTLEVLRPSSARIAPACRHFGICGGCSWQTLDYTVQLEHKQSQVDDCLSRIGGLSGYETDAPLGATSLWRYRNKVEFTFAPGKGGVELGFHLPGQWRQVVDIEDCLLHSELTNHIRNRVRELARESGLGAYGQDSGGGYWRHLVLREAGTGEVMVNLVTGAGEFPRPAEFAATLTAEFPQIASLVWSVNDTRASVATGFPFRVLAGRDHIREEICGLQLRVSPSSFLQTNTAMAARLYQKALDYAAPRGGELVFDLYSGIGSIALLFARHTAAVLGVEIVAEATRQAVMNAEINSLDNARFVTGKVRRVLKELPVPRRPDLVILDPPRAGASRKEIQRIVELSPPRIVYVSCNASTMAANAAQLAADGYRLLRVGAVDMFPHTPHIEVVALLERFPE